MKQFVAEIVSMGRLRHRNLVQLRGYCRRKGELLLVYDYMPNGSLDKILYGSMRPNLNWFRRIRIVRGVACGLLYLHEEWEQVVLHRDIKSANVLLDADLNGKLGDFGLARLYDHGSNPQTTNLVGTIGYLAPELLRTGKATTSSDVFSFGAFMLEVACGRRPMEPGDPSAEQFQSFMVAESLNVSVAAVLTGSVDYGVTEENEKPAPYKTVTETVQLRIWLQHTRSLLDATQAIASKLQSFKASLFQPHYLLF
ncbi:hypothetical protein LWI29_011795 [Acer saccharum]|uniref:non-specific serine/threonine protein kinase n=1 Tax=Acer saccharum TaxID=4024 RepID=A0AA39TF49_ACESA|nr:hypothetical protein LWI29_011795 [Acer saccharum]